MCGRARCTMRADDIPRACHISSRPVRSVNMNRYQPSNNVSPVRDMPVIRREDGGNADGVVLIPSFTKKTDKPDYYKMFNARSESICEKASFRRLVPNNRCLVTLEGKSSVSFLLDHPLGYAGILQLAPRAEHTAASTKYTAADVRITDQKLCVCDICGAFLSVYDSDCRLADHFGGKLHLGYMLIRDKLAELKV